MVDSERMFTTLCICTEHKHANARANSRGHDLFVYAPLQQPNGGAAGNRCAEPLRAHREKKRASG